MKVSNRIFLGTVAVTFFFILLASVVIGYDLRLSAATQSYFEESEPTLQTLEHLRNVVYQDHLLVQQYLETSTLPEALVFAEQLNESYEQCQYFADSTMDLIDQGVIGDQNIADRCSMSILMFGSVTVQRDKLVDMHRMQLEGGVDLRQNISSSLVRYNQLTRDSLTNFSVAINLLSEQNQELQEELLSQKVFINILLLVFFVLLVGTTIVSSFILIRSISRPIDEVIKTSQEFASGNYDARVRSSSSIKEFDSLHTQINTVLDLTQKELTAHPQKAKYFQKKLLPEQYREILDYIKSQQESGRAVTITNIKKHLNLTHPTVQSRLSFLENNNYIVLEKHGRQKIVTLLE